MSHWGAGARNAITSMIIIVAAIMIWPAGALAEETGGAECASISAQGIEKQMNLRASQILVNCGVVPAGSAAGSSESVFGPSFSGSDVDVITGTETYPRVTQSESSVWSHENTIVVNYNDARGDTESPQNLSGVSVSTNSGATFTRLGPPSPLHGHVANDGDPILVYNVKLGKWFAGDLVGGAGTGTCITGTEALGIGLWTSTNGEAWTVGACAHVGSGNFEEGDDRESMWVDDNASSPFYGRMYISFNNYSVGHGALEVVHSDDGVTWSAPVALTSSFRRDVQLTGSPGSDGTVLVVGQEENGGKVGNTGQQNYSYRSTNGGATWTSTTMGPKFTIAGSKSCGLYFPAIPPIWRETGWGQPAVGPNGVVMYDYAAHGEGTDESDIFFVRSTNNGETWSAPVRLNTDSSGKAQWMPSLRVSPSGVVEASWYDRRNTTNGENYQRFARVSTNSGATWGTDEPLSTGMIPQPTQPDPKIQACYAGDYNYTTANATTGFDTWTDGRVSIEGNPVQKVFFHGIAFQTPPIAITEAATSITKTGATLNGTVNPDGVETKYYFEYGTSKSYGKTTAEASAGSGTSNVKESKAITGLAAGEPYDFRIVATNTNKEMSYGANKEFTTPSPAWSVQEPPVPAGTLETRLQGVSCTSSIACTAAGHFLNSSKKIVPLAESWNGTTWSVQEPPSPPSAKEGEIFGTELRGVSCVSTAACTAVGEFVNSGGTIVPLAERWNGTAWSVQEPPSPTGAKDSRLFAVSCTSSTACTAVGDFSNGAGGGGPLAESWNGTAWSLHEPPLPTGSTGADLHGVSCTSSTACTAVGNFRNSAFVEVPLAESWNGTAWSAQEPPSSAGAKRSQLQAGSCTSSTACTAVGDFENSSGTTVPLAERWNGTAWAAQEPPFPTGAAFSESLGVSCASSTACMAVGAYESAAKTLADYWNGTVWSLQTPPNPGGGNWLLGVSCASSITCIAVGNFLNSAGKEVPLAELYQ